MWLNFFNQVVFLYYQGGLFFLKHADEVEREVSPLELHGILLLALQWLSGQITNTPPYYSSLTYSCVLIYLYTYIFLFSGVRKVKLF